MDDAASFSLQSSSSQPIAASDHNETELDSGSHDWRIGRSSTNHDVHPHSMLMSSDDGRLEFEDQEDDDQSRLWSEGGSPSMVSILSASPSLLASSSQLVEDEEQDTLAQVLALPALPSVYRDRGKGKAPSKPSIDNGSVEDTSSSEQKRFCDFEILIFEGALNILSPDLSEE